MDELILLSLEGHATPDQEQELTRWRAASPTNEFRFQELRAVWVLTGMRTEIDRDEAPPTVAEILSRRGKPGVRSRRRPWWVAAACAAAIAFVAIQGDWLARFTNRAGLATAGEYHTGPNELRTAVLADGSVARLGPNTTLRVWMTENRREAEIDGRVFFAVARDESRPFRIYTSEGEVQVLGTRFELDTTRDQIRLMVVDGRVALTAGGASTELIAGELAEAARDRVPTVTRVDSPEERLDWMGAWMAFESTPLWRVAREIEVRLGIRVEIADSALGERTFSGWFSERDREQLLAMICRVAELTCTTGDGVVRMDH